MSSKPKTEEKPKKHKKENKEMKTKIKTIAKHALTVVVTLVVVAGLYALYNRGVEDGKTAQRQINLEIATQVASKTKQSH